MARIQRQQRYTRQPQGTFPKLKREFAGAVFVYLPSVALTQAQRQAMSVTGGVLPVPVQMFGGVLATFQIADAIAAAGTAGLDFSATGFTVLAAGTYQTLNGVQPIEALINRGGASSASGGFIVSLYNTFGGAPASVFSSYDNSGANSAFDSFWVNGVKAASGNGDPATAAGLRYVCAGSAVNGPPACASNIVIGRSSNDGEPLVEFAVVWPRQLSESQMRQVTADPYSIFQPPVRLTAASVAAGNTSIVPGVGNLALTGYVPTISQPQTAAPAAGSLTFTGYAPGVVQGQNVNPGAGSVTFTGYAPSILQPQTAAPGAGTLSFTGYAPTIAQPQTAAPGAGSIVFTGFAPVVAQTANQALTAGAGSIAFTGYAPTLTQTANQAFVPDAGVMTLAGFAPTVTQASASISLVPTVGLLTITGYAPSVAQSGGGDAWGKEKKKRRAQVQAEVNARNLEIIKAELAKEQAIEVEVEPYDDDEEVLMLLL